MDSFNRARRNVNSSSISFCVYIYTKNLPQTFLILPIVHISKVKINFTRPVPNNLKQNMFSTHSLQQKVKTVSIICLVFQSVLVAHTIWVSKLFIWVIENPQLIWDHVIIGYKIKLSYIFREWYLETLWKKCTWVLLMRTKQEYSLWNGLLMP